MPVKMSEDWDINKIPEDEWARKAVYHVPDTDVADKCQNRAQLSLPRNLVIRNADTQDAHPVFGVWSTDYIPKGTRFGPLKGRIFHKNEVPAMANRKYFWRVYKENELFYYIDGYDTSIANWMRYVNPAYRSEAQNLIACQNGENIYFYTIKAIHPEQELLVWYCAEFADRLNYPKTGELMLEKIHGIISTGERQNQEPDETMEEEEEVANDMTRGSDPSMKYELDNYDQNSTLSSLSPTSTSSGTRADEGYNSVSPNVSPNATPEGSSNVSPTGLPCSGMATGVTNRFDDRGHDSRFTKSGTDSSDDESDNYYVLDFSNKKRQDDEDDEEELGPNEYRKVKIKMSKAYYYTSRNHQ